MELDDKKIRKYWIISFCLVASWSLVEALFDFWTEGLGAINYYTGKFIGLGILFGVPYFNAYRDKGVHSLIYMLTALSLAIFLELAKLESETVYLLPLIFLRSCLWYTSYKLLLVNALSYCRIKNDRSSSMPI